MRRHGSGPAAVVTERVEEIVQQAADNIIRTAPQRRAGEVFSFGERDFTRLCPGWGSWWTSSQKFRVKVRAKLLAMNAITTAGVRGRWRFSSER